MHKKERRLLKKILIAALALSPDSFALVPDEQGWVKLKELSKTISQESGFKHITTKTIEQFVCLWEREDFELDRNNKKIRASYSLRKDLNLNYEVCSPPDILFTAIRPKAYRHILKNGFRTKDSPIVSSTSKELAIRRGKWIHNDPILVTIKAFEASMQGCVFYKFGEHLFLSYYIAPEFLYIQTPPPKEDKEKEEKISKTDQTSIKEPPKAEIMGSFFVSSDFGFENRKKSSKLGKDKRRKKDPDWKKIRRQKRRR